MIFAPVNTWIAMQNTGKDDIQLIFIFSAPGFEPYMRCTSAPAGQTAAQLSLDQVRACAHNEHFEYEVLSGPASK